MKRVRIAGVGAAVPEKRVSNNDLAEFIDTSDEWIRSHTGIGNRHFVTEGESCSDLATRAARIALERAGVAPHELDIIILATVTPDYPSFPASACIVQRELGAEGVPAFDLSAACTGFVYAVEMGNAFLKNISGKNALIIGADVLSSLLDWEDRGTAVLFGDGSGAVVLTLDESEDKDEPGILDSLLKADGKGAESLKIPGGGSKFPFSKYPDPKNNTIKMDGRAVYNFAVRVNLEICKELIERNNLTFDDIRYIVPHQANERIIKATAKRASVPIEKFYMNIEEYANTSSASIPIALNEIYDKGLIKKGDLLVFVGFGGGLTYGGNLVRW